MGVKRNFISVLLVFCLAFAYFNIAVLGEASGSGADTDESDSKETETPKRTLSDKAKKCGQIAQFFPKMCEMARVKTECPDQCGEGKIQEGLECGFKIAIDQSKKNKKKKKKKKLSEKKKGKENKSGNKRIVGGKESTQGAWPWQVYLVGAYTPGKIMTCGGAILSKSFILTAAHCVKDSSFVVPMTDPNRWMVWVGNHNKDIQTEPFERSHHVKKIIYHKNFFGNVNTGQQFDDIAIFQLEDEIKMEDENKGRICLPDPNVPIADNDQECYVTGWGKIAEGGESSAILKHAKVFTISKTTCNTQQIYDGLIKDGMKCAGFEAGGTDACQGDSGGSLVCNLQNRWYTTGIVSWGHGCARPSKVGVYTDVKKYKDWIIDSIFDESAPL